MNDVEQMYISRGRVFENRIDEPKVQVLGADPACANRRFDFVFVDSSRSVKRLQVGGGGGVRDGCPPVADTWLPC